MKGDLLLLRNEKGFGRSLALLLLLATSSAIVVGAVQWSGLLSFDGKPARTEKLEIANVTSKDAGGDLLLNIVVKNTGTADAKLEYIVVNGTVVRTFEDLVIVPYNSQITIKILLKNPPFKTGSVVEVRLHTIAGNDFIHLITIPELTLPKFEKIEIVKSYAVKESDGDFTVTIELKNSGSNYATIQYVLVNGKPLDDYGANMAISPSLPASIPEGDSVTFTIFIDGDLFSSGTTLDLKFHSVAGKDYPMMLTLP